MSAGLHFPLFKTYYKAAVIKTVLAYAQKYRYMEQNRKTRNKSLHVYGQLMARWAPDHSVGNS